MYSYNKAREKCLFKLYQISKKFFNMIKRPKQLNTWCSRVNCNSEGFAHSQQKVNI